MKLDLKILASFAMHLSAAALASLALFTIPGVTADDKAVHCGDDADGRGVICQVDSKTIFFNAGDISEALVDGDWGPLAHDDNNCPSSKHKRGLSAGAVDSSSLLQLPAADGGFGGRHTAIERRSSPSWHFHDNALTCGSCKVRATQQ